MQTLLDLHGYAPTFIFFTGGKVRDVKILGELTLEAGALYVMDRGYIDFERLYRFVQESTFSWCAPSPTSCCNAATRALSIRQRIALRQHRHLDFAEFGKGLSRRTAARHLLRSGD